MDTPTHMLLGGIAAYACTGRVIGPRAAGAGALAALLPDLDVFLAPLGDPVLTYELHRHFTHSIFVVPVIGALGAAPFLCTARGRAQWKGLFAAGMIGALTHGLLDVLTSYGTHLFWPFAEDRIALDVMSIIDPVMTGVLFAGLLTALLMRRTWPAGTGLALACLYIGLGFVQRERARDRQNHLAAERGDIIEHSRVMPTLGNLILWRSLYRTPEGVMRADAVRLPLFGPPTIREGTDTRDVVHLDSVVPEGSDAHRRLTRFIAFTDGFASVQRGGAAGTRIISDDRYSMDTAGFVPLWGVSFDPAHPDDPASLTWVTNTDVRRASLGPLIAEILGRPPPE